jgi:hypothetical protein
MAGRRCITIFVYKSYYPLTTLIQGNKWIKCFPFLHKGLQAFFSDACFKWDDGPARRMKRDVLDKFPELSPFCESFNWRDRVPAKVFVYLAASVSRFQSLM